MFIIIKIQIPNSIVKNSGIILDDKTFSLYVYLIYLEFRSSSQKGESFKIKHKDIMSVLRISDIRTLKKSLNSLYECNLISERIDKLPRNGIQLDIKLIHLPDQYFTQLPSTVLYKINDIGHTGIRLLFYYESYINRKNEKEFAYPSQETIIKDLKYSFSTLDKYNKLLVKYKLIKVVTHDFILDGFDELDKPIFTRYNNHYYINLENL